MLLLNTVSQQNAQNITHIVTVNLNDVRKVKKHLLSFLSKREINIIYLYWEVLSFLSEVKGFPYQE